MVVAVGAKCVCDVAEAQQLLRDRERKGGIVLYRPTPGKKQNGGPFSVYFIRGCEGSGSVEEQESGGSWSLKLMVQIWRSPSLPTNKQ